MAFRMTDEIQAKLKSCKSPEELMKLARENNLDFSMEDIRNAVNGKGSPLSDEELDQIAAGGCAKASGDCLRRDYCPRYLHG